MRSSIYEQFAREKRGSESRMWKALSESEQILVSITADRGGETSLSKVLTAKHSLDIRRLFAYHGWP